MASSSAAAACPESSMAIMASSSSSPPLSDDNFEEDSCSICLEPFNSADPATITSCKHEYHLHCILEWSQRSKECPICWQLLALKDPASQELLSAVEKERRSRSRSAPSISSPPVHFFQEDEDSDNDSFSDEFVFDERIMRHLAAAASRARLRGRERNRSSGLGASQVFIYTSPTSGEDQAHETPSEECYNFTHESSVGNSPSSGTPPAVNAQPSSPPAVPSSAINGAVVFKPRVLYSQPPSVRPQRPIPSETSTLSDSIKSRWSAASARYKESFSKGTRGLKEKLIARNNSVKELSKGVQREMSAGIVGVQRMIERFDLSSKRAGVSLSPPDSSRDGITPISNLSTKGKGVLENIIVQSLSKNGGKVTDNVNSDVATPPSIVIPGRVEVSRSKE